MFTFPNDSQRGISATSITLEQAQALVVRHGGALAEDALIVLEEISEPAPPLSSAMLADYAAASTEISLSRRDAGDVDAAAFMEELLQRMLAPPSASDEDEVARVIKLVDGAELRGSWSNDEEVDCLIVMGDLTVDGTLSLNWPEESPGVIVLGSLRTRNFVCGGRIVVRDDVECEHVYACSLNDGALTIGGSLTVRSFIETGHYMEVKGDFDASFVATLHNEIDVGGEIRCAGFQSRSDRDRLPEWVDAALLEHSQTEDDNGAAYSYWYPTEAYEQRIIDGGSPVRSGLLTST
jgi:hypothetical protein